MNKISFYPKNIFKYNNKINVAYKKQFKDIIIYQIITSYTFKSSN